MGTRLLFYLCLYPLSLLPLSAIYALFYPFYGLLYYVIGYRKKVVIENLQSSFPEYSRDQITKLSRQYYRHLVELAAEMVKMLTLSKKTLRQRYHCTNPEILLPYFQQKKSVILLSSHYNNWEWMVLGIDKMFSHQGVGVGKPNTNKVFEKLINAARTRYGTIVVFQDTVRDFVKQNIEAENPCAYMMLSDQSPNHISKSYITQFLHQPTAIIYGGEYFAKKYNLPVFYYEVRKIKRGYYELNISTITEHPNQTAYGEITSEYVQLLEQTIQTEPAYWLWSHKRWKRKNEVLKYLENEKNK